MPNTSLQTSKNPVSNIVINPSSTPLKGQVEKPLFMPVSKPQEVSTSGVTVTSVNPIIVDKKPLPPIKEDLKPLEIIEPIKEEEQSWWSKKSKKQKTMFIGGVVLISVIAFIVYRKRK